MGCATICCFASVADELLRPSVLYAPAVGAVLDGGVVHAIAHITGGGLPGNLGRVLPPGADAVVDRGTWEEPDVFGEIRPLMTMVEVSALIDPRMLVEIEVVAGAGAGP